MIRMCCVCRRIEHEGRWRVESVDNPQKVSHVYCPPCYDDLVDEIDRFASQKSYRYIYTIIHPVLP